MFYIDPYYILIVGPAIVLSIIAQIMVKSTFSKYSSIQSKSRLTGAEAARRVLDYMGLQSVSIERVRGSLTDHYDPSQNVLRLSETVHDSYSVAAIAVAAHEAGHAVQKSVKYHPLVLRSLLVPIANFGSNLGPWLIIIGFALGLGRGDFGYYLVLAGIILFAAAVLFYIVTLPVEFNASKRALAMLVETSIVDEDEKSMAKRVLSAAAMTYVASALVAVANLLRFILIARDRR